MLGHDCRETRLNEWRIACSAESAANLLYYFYSNELPPLADDRQTLVLLQLANLYNITSLKRRCELYLRRHIQLDNACALLIHADVAVAQRLRRAACTFVQRHLLSVMHTSGWRMLCLPAYCHLLELVTTGSEASSLTSIDQRRCEANAADGCNIIGFDAVSNSEHALSRRGRRQVARGHRLTVPASWTPAREKLQRACCLAEPGHAAQNESLNIADDTTVCLAVCGAAKKNVRPFLNAQIAHTVCTRKEICRETDGDTIWPASHEDEHDGRIVMDAALNPLALLAPYLAFADDEAPDGVTRLNSVGQSLETDEQTPEERRSPPVDYSPGSGYVRPSS